MLRIRSFSYIAVYGLALSPEGISKAVFSRTDLNCYESTKVAAKVSTKFGIRSREKPLAKMLPRLRVACSPNTETKL